MPEILTESFCERCGTRYTFESAAPTKARKLGRFKTLSKGLKNYVLSDDTSLDEAMAEARNDEERQVTAQQLDAFHSTFNFCMSCRQYTCANCWNEIEGICLSCAPHLGHEILPAPFPTFVADVIPEPERVDDAWPMADIPAAAVAGSADSNGHHDVEEIDVAERLAQLTFGTAAAEPTTPIVEAAPAPVAAAAAQTTELEATAADHDAPDTTPVEEPSVPGRRPVELHAAVPPFPPATDIEGRAAAAAARTAVLLGRFRPGQSIDAELEAYEASLADANEAPSDEAAVSVAASVEAEPVADSRVDEVPVSIVEAEPVAPAEPIAAAVELVASEPEPEPIAAEPEPLAAEAESIAIEPGPKPIAAEPEPIAAEPAVEPLAAERSVPEPRKDHVEQPTWRIVAPDSPQPATTGREAIDPGLAAAASAKPASPADPQWPTTPQWPTAAPAATFLGDRLADRSTAALWAASARDVVSPPGGVPTTGIQPCSNCGLSLSATARFCRRCGSRQGG
jgi:hypothetical protein